MAKNHQAFQNDPNFILKALKENNAVKDQIPRNLDFLLTILKLDEKEDFNKNYSHEILILRKLADEIIMEENVGKDDYLSILT